jgi:hypothetical protein
MRKLILSAIFALVAFPVLAQDAAPSYSDVIKTCGAEWRERADKATNKGRDAWNAFRVECVARKGYVTKAKARDASFSRVPDATKAN